MSNTESKLTFTQHILLHLMQTTSTGALDKAIKLARESTSAESTKTWPEERVLATRRARLGEELRALVENACDVAAALDKEIADRKAVEDSLLTFKTKDMDLLVELVRISGDPNCVAASIVIQHLRASMSGHGSVASPFAFLELFENLEPENRQPLGWGSKHDASTRAAIDKAVIYGVRRFGLGC